MLPNAEKLLEEVAAEDPWDWRVQWFRGRMRLATGDCAQAQKDFDQVYFDLPGELPPKLALGFAAERAGNMDLACHMYDLVSRVDDSYVSAAFGLSRSAFARGDRAAAANALSRIPQSSSVYVRSRVQSVAALTSNGKTPPSPADLMEAANTTEGLSLDLFHRSELQSRILHTALDLLRAKKLTPADTVTLFGYKLHEPSLRVALERTLRAMAQLVTGEQRIRLVDEANRVRPLTLV